MENRSFAAAVARHPPPSRWVVPGSMLADRLVTYADALAAVSFVGTSGLSLALADPDVRCSLIHGVHMVAIGNFAFAGLMSALLLVLRHWENDLRSDEPLSRKAEAISRRLHVARFVVIWLSTIGAVATMMAAGRDPTCGP